MKEIKANIFPKLMKDIGYGADYKYPHDYPGHYIRQQYMPDELKNIRIWQCQNNGTENKLHDYMQSLKEKN